MDYIGSKEKLNEWIFGYIDKCINVNNVFLDACSGSSSVSRYAASKGYKVISNDNMHFPSHLANGSIGVDAILDEGKKHIEAINALNGTEGLFYKEYCPAISERMYFTIENAQRIDACRDYIHKIENKKLKSFLIYCAIEAISRASNTAGTYGAYLKKFKERAKNNFTLKVEDTVLGEVKAYTSDILVLLQKIRNQYDLMYIDPPYNTRKYAPNYHIYESFVRKDDPEVKGITGLRKDWQSESDSDFCKKSKAEDFFYKILVEATSPVFISYSSDGLLTLNKLEEIVVKSGRKFNCHFKSQRRYKADNKRQYKADDLFEYLIVAN